MNTTNAPNLNILVHRLCNTTINPPSEQKHIQAKMLRPTRSCTQVRKGQLVDILKKDTKLNGLWCVSVMQI